MKKQIMCPKCSQQAVVYESERVIGYEKIRCPHCKHWFDNIEKKHIKKQNQTISRLSIA